MGKLDAFKEIVQTNAPLSELTWLRIGGPIEFLASPRSEEELVALLKASRREKLVTRAIGDGSNILASDVGAPGLAVRLFENAFCQIKIDSPYAEVGAGVKLGALATELACAGLAGLEGLAGVPGTVGAGVALNVSTADVSLGQCVESARVATYDGTIHELSQDDFIFGYRSANLSEAIILSVRFRLDPDSPEELSKRLQKIWIARLNHRPEVKSGEGLARMFKNPRGQNAADLIDDAGFRGAKFGGASVCETDPNLLQTSANCSSDDVKRLLLLIQTQARERLGVELERELELW